MTENSSKTSQQPSENKSDSAEKPTQPSINSSGVREYLYLDQEKVLSYLSQIQGGLRLLVEQVERQFRSQENTTPQNKSAVESTIEAELLGKIPLVADATVHGTYKSARETTTGNDKVSFGRFGQRANISTVHHEALELVEREMGSKLVHVRGFVQFINFDDLLETIKDFPEFTKNFNAVTGQKLATPANTKQIHYLISKSSAGRILVLVLDEDGVTTTSYLHRDKLTADPRFITDNYGIRFGSEFTLVGVEATPFEEKPDFSLGFTQSHEDGLDMGRHLVDLIQKQEGMKTFWELRSKERHIYPVAMYRTL
ncbi:hypothetical protein Dxin01_04049 [Deinococcus xinjiangensis]|uniref:Uncharacterized protein n=1 Tax=Deinococcus xinjiangensis TaxID=457454 RepID=A0ABP9VI87_9DEIO